MFRPRSGQRTRDRQLQMHCTSSVHHKPNPRTPAPLTRYHATLFSSAFAVVPLPSRTTPPYLCPALGELQPPFTTMDWMPLATVPACPSAHSSAPPGTSSKCAQSCLHAQPAQRCSWSPWHRRCSPQHVPLPRPSCRCRWTRSRSQRRRGLTHREVVPVGGCSEASCRCRATAESPMHRIQTAQGLVVKVFKCKGGELKRAQ